MMEADGLVALWKENSTLKNYLALHNLENIVVIVIKISEDAIKKCFFCFVVESSCEDYCATAESDSVLELGM